MQRRDGAWWDACMVQSAGRRLNSGSGQARRTHLRCGNLVQRRQELIEPDLAGALLLDLQGVRDATGRRVAPGCSAVMQRATAARTARLTRAKIRSADVVVKPLSMTAQRGAERRFAHELWWRCSEKVVLSLPLTSGVLGQLHEARPVQLRCRPAFQDHVIEAADATTDRSRRQPLQPRAQAAVGFRNNARSPRPECREGAECVVQGVLHRVVCVC